MYQPQDPPTPVLLDGAPAMLTGWDADFEGAYAYLTVLGKLGETWVHWPNVRVQPRPPQINPTE